MPTLKMTRCTDREYNVSLAQRRNWYADPPAGDPEPTPLPPPPAPTPAPVAKFTQEDMDAVAGNTRKEASASAIKTLLKQLGGDPDDPKAVETLKGKLATAQKAEDDKKSAETLALEKIVTLEKERDDAKTAHEAVIQERNVEKRDSRIVRALTNANARDAEDLLILMDRKKPDLVKAVMKDDGTIDEKKLTDLVAVIKTDYKEKFIGRSPGSPSNLGGGNPELHGAEKDEARRALTANLRNKF